MHLYLQSALFLALTYFFRCNEIKTAQLESHSSENGVTEMKPFDGSRMAAVDVIQRYWSRAVGVIRLFRKPLIFPLQWKN
jgi:hypothetical protein